MEIKIVRLEEFQKYQDALVTMYIETFSSSKSFQYHSKVETQNYLRSIFEVGYGVLAFDGTSLTGAILLTPLTFDNLVPDKITQHFEVDKSVYIAEMMVEKTQQGRGIGKKLLNYFLETVDRNLYQDAFIRVWIENKAAVHLYNKMGFKKCASIVQPKMLADKSGLFNFQKIYLHQKLK